MKRFSLLALASAVVTVTFVPASPVHGYGSSENALVATMYQSPSRTVTLEENGSDQLFSGAEYFYRLTDKSTGEVVDVQSTARMTQMSYQEQYDYYLDYWGEDSYTFEWKVAICEDESSQSFPLIDTHPDDVVVNQIRVPFVTTDSFEIESFWAREVMDDSYTRYLASSQYLKGNPALTSYSGPFYAFPEYSYPAGYEISSEYLMRHSQNRAEVICPDGMYGQWYQIKDSQGNPVEGRELDLDTQHYIELYDWFSNEITSKYEPIDLEDRFVAVYGAAFGDFSVANLGLTQVSTVNFEVSFHPNGATSGDLPQDEVVPAGDYTLPGNPGNLSREGYRFLGWSKAFGASIVSSSVEIDSDTKLYAIWEPDGGSTSISAQVTD